MKKILTILSTIMVVCLTLTGCGSSSNNEDADQSSQAIIIGGSGPLTGGAAVYGTAVKNSAELAVKEINAKGGQQFKLVFEDDAHDPEKAVTAYGALIDAGMQVSLGCVTSGPGSAVSPNYNEDNIFTLTPSGSSPSVTLKNINDETSYYGNIFQMCFSDPNQGLASAQYIKDNNVGTKVGIIFKSDDTYSTGIVEKFEAKAKEIGLEYVECGTFDSSSESDFSVQVKACADANCDVVFLPIYYQPASLILTEANKIGYTTKFFGVDGMDGILSQENFDTSLAEGVYLLTPFNASATDELTQNYVKNYTATYGTDTLTQFGADAYDCIYAIAQACENAGVTADMSASDICDLLKAEFTKMTFEGLTGVCKWSENGTVDKTPKAVIIKNGEYVSAE